jgi:hypothetical protein
MGIAGELKLGLRESPPSRNVTFRDRYLVGSVTPRAGKTG